MKENESYSPLNEQDKELLKKLWLRRWIDVAKRFVFSFALPFWCAGTIINFLTRISRDHASFADFSDIFKLILFVWTPVFCMIAIGNLILFLKYVLSLFIDKVRGIKKVIRFYPSAYDMSEFDKYYIQTDLPDFPFFEVSYDLYHKINTNEMLSLEILPVTKHFLALKNADETQTIDIIPA